MEIATARGGGTPVDPPPIDLALQVLLLRRHCVALEIVCAHAGQHSAEVAKEAGAVRARSHRLRQEAARGRAARDLRRREGWPTVPLHCFSALLAGVISDSENVQEKQREDDDDQD